MGSPGKCRVGLNDPLSAARGGMTRLDAAPTDGITRAARESPVVPGPPLDTVSAHGKFLYAGSDKLYVRGVTYGAFEPSVDGTEYHDAAQISRDFTAMRANGINAVR